MDSTQNIISFCTGKGNNMKDVDCGESLYCEETGRCMASDLPCDKSECLYGAYEEYEEE